MDADWVVYPERDVVTVTVACVPSPVSPETVIKPDDERTTVAGVVTVTDHV
jgi:hypothetical protein